jgi:hypothetical protein
MMNRIRPWTTLGSCAALALAAGAALGQTRGDSGMYRDMSMHRDSGMQFSQQAGDWKSAHSLRTSSDVVLAGKTHDGRDVNVIFTQGRLSSAEIDQNLIDPNRVQMKGDRVRIVDRDGQSNLVTFTLPRHLAMHGDMGPVRSDRFSDQGFRDDRSVRQTQQFRPVDRTLQGERFRSDERYFPPQRTTFQEQQTTRVYGSDFDTQPMQLGISMSDASRNELARLDTQANYASGIRVERVHSGTPAERAGLRTGDIIVRVDSEPASTTTLQRAMSQKRAGEPLNLRIVRDDRERNLNVRLDSRSMQTFGQIDPWQSAAPPVQPEMPNVQHPGPFNEYRPTQPDWTHINRDTGLRRDRFEDTRFRDDRFYGTDTRDDRYGVTEYRTQRYEFDTRPQQFRDDRMYRDDRYYRSNEFRDDSFDSPRLRFRQDDRFDSSYSPRSDRLQFEQRMDDGRILGTYDFDDGRFSTTHHDFGDVHTYDLREGRIYGTDDRLHGAMDHDRDLYIEREVRIRETGPDVRYYFDDTPGLETPSTIFRTYDMPNVEHPGPFNIYRPTQPTVNEMPRR